MLYRQYVIFALSSFFTIYSVGAQELESFTINVMGEGAHVDSEKSYSDLLSPGIEGGEQLRMINGVSASRKGGKGFEPVIRGQQQSQLNILLDNAQVLGACPGRMDPPTSYVSPAGYDRVQVIKGYESVVYGSGGSGGTVLYERDVPKFGTKHYIGRLGAGFQSNSETASTLMDMAIGSSKGYLRTYGGYTNAGNYQDGDGQTVSSSYRSASGGLVLAGEVMEGVRLDFNVEATRDRDILYSGNGMDAPYADADFWRLKVNIDQSIGWIDEQELSISYSDIHHLMDNYSVRKRNSSTTGLEAPSTSKTYGGRWLATRYEREHEWRFGIDYFNNQRNAERYKTDLNSAEKSLQAIMWPSVEYNHWGLFIETDLTLSEEDVLRIGGRVDRFSAEAGKVGEQALGVSSPDTLYQKYYGYSAEVVTETNINGLVSWQHRLDEHQLLELRGSRSIRTADASERYLASRGSCCHGSDDWVGNPRIKPEKHHQLDVGYHYHRSDLRTSSVIYIDEVSDYILRYQSNDGPYLYRNTEARLYGVEFEVEAIYGSWKPAFSINWTRGINKSANSAVDGNLPQIPALLTTVGLAYERSLWGVGSRCEFAASQDQVNVNSGLDSGGSPGFGVCHLHGHYHLSQQVKIRGGMDNVFNKTYGWHINKRSKDPFSPDASTVNEPGRAVWLGIDVNF